MHWKVCAALDSPKEVKKYSKMAKWRNNSSFWNNLRCIGDLEITFHRIDFFKIVLPYKPLERSCMFGKGYLLGVVAKLKQR
jgi:hypothetical protein